MRESLRIVIVGYGTAGQAAALFLAAQRHSLNVYEQAPVPGPVGAGIRDALSGPLGQLPLTRSQMLRILTGTKAAWWR